MRLKKQLKERIGLDLAMMETKEPPRNVKLGDEAVGRNRSGAL